MPHSQPAFSGPPPAFSSPLSRPGSGWAGGAHESQAAETPSTMNERIPAKRLSLATLGRDFLDAMLNGDAGVARSLLGWTIPEEWFEEERLMSIRSEDCEADPLYIPWSLRAVVHRASSTMVGPIGFHSRPGRACLESFAPAAWSSAARHSSRTDDKAMHWRRFAPSSAGRQAQS